MPPTLHLLTMLSTLFWTCGTASPGDAESLCSAAHASLQTAASTLLNVVWQRAQQPYGHRLRRCHSPECKATDKALASDTLRSHLSSLQLGRPCWQRRRCAWHGTPAGARGRRFNKVLAPAARSQLEGTAGWWHLGLPRGTRYVCKRMPPIAHSTEHPCSDRLYLSDFS